MADNAGKQSRQRTSSVQTKHMTTTTMKLAMKPMMLAMMLAMMMKAQRNGTQRSAMQETKVKRKGVASGGGIRKMGKGQR